MAVAVVVVQQQPELEQPLMAEPCSTSQRTKDLPGPGPPQEI